MKGLVVALALLPFAAFAGDSVFPTKAERKNAELLEPKNVSERTRSYLKTKMKNHGSDAQRLALEIALLQWDQVKAHANDIAVQPRLDRAAAAKDGASDLNEGFFQLQDLLRTRATELAGAAERKDPKAASAAMGALLDTCSTCHSAYAQPAAPTAEKKP